MNCVMPEDCTGIFLETRIDVLVGIRKNAVQSDPCERENICMQEHSRHLLHVFIDVQANLRRQTIRGRETADTAVIGRTGPVALPVVKFKSCLFSDTFQ